MSDILIRGIEMPTSCESCPCKTADAFGGLGCQATGYIPLRKVNQDRPENCPLVEIPPHGDLIERSAIGLSDFEIVMCRGDYKDGMRMLLEKVESAPTIIPAEEGE